MSYNQDYLTRSFYLSNAVYNDTIDLDGYWDENTRTYLKFNEKLIQIIKQNTTSAVFRPVYYVGTQMDMHSGKHVYVAIRGSKDFVDFATDRDVQRVMAQGSFHMGFLLSATNVWNDIKYVIKRHLDDGFNIIFTGHSYGGAVAQILHLFAQRDYPNKISEFTSYVFGAPASMSTGTASPIKSSSHAFIYENDIVPRLMNYVTALSSSLIFPQIQLNICNIPKYQHNVVYKPSGTEKITEPVGTIYHIPYHNTNKSTWGSIKSTVKTIDFKFYVYEPCKIQFAISDHSLSMYFQYLQYIDGLKLPGTF